MPVVRSHTKPESRTRLIRLGLFLILAGLAAATVYRFYDQRTPAYQVQVFQTPGGWGYDILRNDKPLIHQPTIPGQSGIVGFASPGQARRVGERVVEKIQQTQTLPTLTNDELRQLGVKIP